MNKERLQLVEDKLKELGYQIVPLELNKNKNKQSMTKKEKLAEVKTQDGLVIYTDAEAMAVDVEVYGMDADGNRTEIADGDYVLESGETVVIMGGKVSEIKEMETTVDTEEEMSAEIKATIESFVQPLIQSLTDSVNELTKQVTDLKSENVRLSTQLSKIPGSTGIVKDDKQEKEKNTNDKSASFDEKIKQLAEFRKQSKK